MSGVRATSDAEFETVVLGADKPVLVDFWAPWCTPCRLLAPVLDDLAVEFADDLVVVKVDVEANPLVRERYGVSSLPTMALFRGGEVVHTIVGVRSRTALRAEMTGLL